MSFYVDNISLRIAELEEESSLMKCLIGDMTTTSHYNYPNMSSAELYSHGRSSFGARPEYYIAPKLSNRPPRLGAGAPKCPDTHVKHHGDDHQDKHHGDDHHDKHHRGPCHGNGHCGKHHRAPCHGNGHRGKHHRAPCHGNGHHDGPCKKHQSPQKPCKKPTPLKKSCVKIRGCC